jgi:hypothetical protein
VFKRCRSSHVITQVSQLASASHPCRDGRSIAATPPCASSAPTPDGASSCSLVEQFAQRLSQFIDLIRLTEPRRTIDGHLGTFRIP